MKFLRAKARLTCKLPGKLDSPAADSPSVPTSIEWGSPPSDGTSRAGWRQVTLHQADWRKVDREDQTAFEAVSPAQVVLETGWDFSLPFPIHRLEDNLLGAPPIAPRRLRPRLRPLG